ncbi:MAG: glycosyltransferase family 2 protein [Anaerolineae bacterium]
MFVSILLPAYNEEGNILPMTERTFATLNQHQLQGEILLVDDGSRDHTWEEVQEAQRRFPNVRIFRHSRNRGLSYALSTGFQYMQGDIVILLGADLQFAPEEVIPSMLAKFDEGYDVVLGRKENEKIVGLRRIASPLNNWLLRKLFNVPARHMNAARAFRREVVEDMHLRSEWHSLMVAIAAVHGWRIGEVPVTVYPRIRGESKFNGRSYMFALFDLFTLRLMLTFENRPMTLFGMVAFVLFAIAFAGVVYMVVDYLSRPVDFFRPMLVISGGAFLAGLLLLLIGFVAEMIVNQNEILREQREQLQELRRQLAEQQERRRTDPK